MLSRGLVRFTESAVEEYAERRRASTRLEEPRAGYRDAFAALATLAPAISRPTSPLNSAAINPTAGTWQARYEAPDGRERSKTFGRKVDAQRFLDEVTASVVTGMYVDLARAT